MLSERDAKFSHLMKEVDQRLRSPFGVYSVEDAELALARVFGAGVRPLRLEEAVWEAMLKGWTAQQTARYFKPKTIRADLQAARSFASFTGRWPWQWHAEDVDSYFSALLEPPRGLRPISVRGYQARLRGLVGYLIDERYPWVAICRHEFGRAPAQLFDDRHGLAHLTGFEGDPRRRPLTVDELEAFFACCDARTVRRRGLGRKGELAAWRDQAAFKVMFAWGLRRAETASLDVVDFRPHAALPEFGGFAALHVRYGKSMAGGPPRRRTVLTVFDWAAEVVEQYLSEVRPALRPGDAPAVFVTERATRMAPGWITDRFAELRDEAGLPGELTPHCLRHSYVTHLAELGYADRFIQDQVGHSHSATTAIYLSVSDDFKNRMVRTALDRQLTAAGHRR